jgi:hypothetical protein
VQPRVLLSSFTLPFLKLTSPLDEPLRVHGILNFDVMAMIRTNGQNQVCTSVLKMTIRRQMMLK